MSMTAQSSELRERVQNEIVWDPMLTANTIGVTSTDGIVTLTGYVGSYVEKIAAEAAALRVVGTRAVANDLVVPRESERIDPVIARDADCALRVNLNVPPTVKVTVKNGHVTLEGTCEWWYQWGEAVQVGYVDRDANARVSDSKKPDGYGPHLHSQVYWWRGQSLASPQRS